MTIAINGGPVQITSDASGKLTVWGTASMTSTLASNQSWTLQLLVGDEYYQTYVADKVGGAFSQTLGLTVTLTSVSTWKLEADLSTYQWCKLVSTGNATLSVTDQRLE